MPKWRIYNEDVVEWAKSYKKGKFHALLCDPPYHLTSIVKRFGKEGSAPAKFGTDGVFARSSAGFMGQEWDGGDIAFRPETWAAFHDVLYPGAFGMAFSASRNWHRLAVAIEDAGYIIHPTIFLWVNGQGFPKATNIDKQIDKNSGVERKNGKLRNDGRGADPIKLALRKHGDTGIGHADGSHQQYFETDPATDLAKAWVGHRYGLQALKPAVEPIIVFQKPYEGKPLDNITQTGAGALNIDAARIGVDGGGTQCDNRDDEGNCLGHPSANGSLGGGVMRHAQLRPINRFKDGAKPWGNGAGHDYETELTEQGRWPSNLILEEGSAQALDSQTGNLGKSQGGHSGHEHMYQGGYKEQEYYGNTKPGFHDEGGASRFFYVVQDKIDEADPAYYCGKVSKKERNAGLKEKNNHPTLKPIDLSRYLATLLLPPEEYKPRRILVPFSGVASEMIGAGLAGWEQIVGIEFDTKNGYIDIAEKRLEHWLR